MGALCGTLSEAGAVEDASLPAELCSGEGDGIDEPVVVHGSAGMALSECAIVQAAPVESVPSGFRRHRSAMLWMEGPIQMDENSTCASEHDVVQTGWIERSGTLPFKVAESSSLTLEDLVDLIKGHKVNNIVVLSGAGVSTAAGIPDFRSKGGFYDTLRPEHLTLTDEQRHSMAGGGDAMCQVVHADLWAQTQVPLLESHRELIVGTAKQAWRPTLAHWFFAFLEGDGLLRRLYTQNIDGLELQTGIPNEKIVNVHGTIAKAFCCKCKCDVDAADFGRSVEAHIKDVWGASPGPPTSTPIPCPECGATRVRPAITLFGEKLPERFHSLSQEDVESADLLIVTGTSLKVAPASKLPGQVHKACPRLVVNRDVPKGFSTSVQNAKRLLESLSPKKLYTLIDPLMHLDVLLLGETDDCFLEIMLRLGWHDRLRQLLQTENLSPKSAESVRRRLHAK
mmetsp:Transcript_42720/g.107430  ORF Transcript_42720/g.107430 Transcript_42720/m.107430 type:complete len:453 (+) Transcript_42720:65-1423(+)